MTSIIKNQELIRHLVEVYYGDDPSLKQDPFVSSDWQRWSQLFKIETNDDGNLSSLSGVAFGTLRWLGLHHRLSDYLTIATHMLHLRHRRKLFKLYQLATKTCDAMGLDPTIDVFRQSCTLATIARDLPPTMRQKQLNVLVIGDGFGVLSSMFKSVFPNSTVVMIDIGKTLLFQAYYCQRAHPVADHVLATAGADLQSAEFVYCPAEQMESLGNLRFDLAVNTSSMQEMNDHTIQGYFDFLRSHFHTENLFYCCNRESKTMEGGEVSEFMNYPWREDDRHLVDEVCPWLDYFFSWGRNLRGLNILGKRVPMVNYYDGVHLHRLTVLATDPVSRTE